MSETSTAGVKNNLLRRAALAGMFAAAGVVLSVVSIPVGPTKCFPFQHAINVIAGVTLGPAWAVGAAFTTSLVRNMLGTGSLFAFPGSMFGALLDGIAAMLLPQKYKIAAAVAEPSPDLLPGAENRVRIPVPTERRGRLRPGPPRAETDFPFGLFVCRAEPEPGHAPVDFARYGLREPIDEVADAFFDAVLVRFVEHGRVGHVMVVY